MEQDIEPQLERTPMDLMQQDIIDFAQEREIKIQRHSNVLPDKDGPYGKYTFVFMSPMQPGHEDLYFGDAPEPRKPEIILGQCVRTDGSYITAGRSPRHMKSFTMIGLSGVHDQTEAIELQYDLLTYLLRDTQFTIVPRVNPADTLSINYFETLGIPFDLSQQDDCIFNEPNRTDRTGLRVEMIAKGVNDRQEEIAWELANCVVLTSINNGGTSLETPIMDTGGSLERILALREETCDVFDTAAYPHDEVNTLVNPHQPIEGRTIEKILDLSKTILVMSNSGLVPKTGKHRSKGEKEMNSAIRELTLTYFRNDIYPINIRRIMDVSRDFLRDQSPTEININDEVYANVIEYIENYVLTIFERATRMKEVSLSEKSRGVFGDALIKVLSRRFGSDQPLAEIIVSSENLANIPFGNLTISGKRVPIEELREEPGLAQANYTFNRFIRNGTGESEDRRTQLNMWGEEFFNKGLSEGVDTFAVGALVTNDQNQTLVLKRSASEKYGAGEPDLPGGSIKPTEHLDLTTGLGGEIFEEAGINDPRFVDIIGHYDFSWKGKITRVAIMWVKSNGPVTLGTNHDDFSWVSQKDISDIRFNLLGDKEMALHLANHLEKQE